MCSGGYSLFYRFHPGAIVRPLESTMPPLFLESDPIGNALALILWGLVIALSVGVFFSAVLWFSAGEANRADPAPRVRRRRIL